MKRLGCGHVFHATCVDLWGETAHTCPLCKTDFAELAREAANATAGVEAAGGVGAAPAAAPAGAPPPARRPNRWFRGFTMLRTVKTLGAGAAAVRTGTPSTTPRLAAKTTTTTMMIPTEEAEEEEVVNPIHLVCHQVSHWGLLQVVVRRH